MSDTDTVAVPRELIERIIVVMRQQRDATNYYSMAEFFQELDDRHKPELKPYIDRLSKLRKACRSETEFLEIQLDQALRGIPHKRPMPCSDSE